MIDIHSHIIPEIDDGSNSVATTFEMLKIAQLNGIKKIIATPHYCLGCYENNLMDIKRQVKELNFKLAEAGMEIKLLSGQEILLDKNTISLYKDGIIGGLNDTHYMLFELPFDYMPDYTMDIIYELRILGVVPILAHPERYKFIIDKPSNINSFVEEGCLFQINSHSITGLFGKEVKRTAELLIKNRIVNFVASDAHSSGARSPAIKKAMDIVRLVDGELASILENNSYKLIMDEPIEYDIDKLIEKKRFLFNIRNNL